MPPELSRLLCLWRCPPGWRPEADAVIRFARRDARTGNIKAGGTARSDAVEFGWRRTHDAASRTEQIASHTERPWHPHHGGDERRNSDPAGMDRASARDYCDFRGRSARTSRRAAQARHLRTYFA